MLPATLYLIDRSQELAREWQEQFVNCPGIEILSGDYFQKSADAIVSPANSFGIMDGGLDLAIRNELGFAIEQKVQEVIVQKYHGELPVGCAEIVDTNDMRWKYLIAAPTMRIPELIRFTINTYLAFRAILVAIENFNQAHGVAAINSCICPGLGTGVGGVSAATCARQMRAAYQTMKSVARIPSYEAIHEFHSTLLRL
jgi:O-acetyl-ADP-ribose deacetylase (regulator of RNase III)